MCSCKTEDTNKHLDIIDEANVRSFLSQILTLFRALATGETEKKDGKWNLKSYTISRASEGEREKKRKQVNEEWGSGSSGDRKITSDRREKAL